MIKLSVKTLMIMRLHSEGLGIKQIFNEIVKVYPDSKRFAVGLILNRRGLKAHPPIMPRKTTLNEDYFEEINTHRTAYFFGLICADGNVHSGSKRVRLGLKKEDGYLIEELKTELNSSSKICVFKPKLGGWQSALQLYSEKMVSHLIKNGCGDRKSLTLLFPEIKKIYLGSFIRGYFDGDGCICENLNSGKLYKRISLIGSIPFIESLKTILKDVFDIKSSVYVRKNKRYSEINIISQPDILKFREVIYEYDSVSMKRKKRKILY